MREDPTVEADGILELGATGDNIVALPNLASGRLAELLAAASGPAQDRELRGEMAARTAFVAASSNWPTARRRFRRTPAVLAVTTVATMMVATTGLAAASELPGPAGRAVQGILGTVGVTVETPAPVAPAPAPTAAVTVPGSHSVAWSLHSRSARRGCATGNAPTTGPVETASCTIDVPRHAVSAAPAVVPPASLVPVRTKSAAGPTVARGAGGASGAGGAGQHRGGVQSTGSGTSGGTGTPPGGGTSRGGNEGAGGGSCDPADGGTTTTTDPGTTTTTDPSTTDPSTTTTTTDPTGTDPSGTGCGGHEGGHHHGGTDGGTGGSGGTTGGSTS